MASLILQDSFDPYYAGRDHDDEVREGSLAPTVRLRERGSRELILLPSEAPARVCDARRERRPVAH